MNAVRPEWVPIRCLLVWGVCWGLAVGDEPAGVAREVQADSTRAIAAVSAARNATGRMFARDTPEYTAAFRHIVGAMTKAQAADATDPAVFASLASMQMTPFDRDPLFRANVAKSVNLSMSAGLVQRFVLDSEPDTRNEFPDVVLVQGPGQQICSGIIIKANRVLTARHCVCDGITLSVGLGVVYSTLSYKPIIEQRPTKSECTTVPTSDIDVGVVYTDAGIVQSSKFPPYAASQLISTAQAAIVVGYGVSVFGSRGSAGDRRFAPVSVVSNSCQGTGPNATGAVVADSVRFGCVPKLTLVAASTTGADQCDGDSGGALLAVDGTGKRYLAGVVSTPTVASALHGNCGQGGIYMRLDAPEVAKWIAANL